jgi:hypothetical protein
VIDDLGFSPGNAAALKFKAELYRAILKYAKKYSQRELPSDFEGTTATSERIVERKDRQEERRQAAVLRGTLGHRDKGDVRTKSQRGGGKELAMAD